MHEMATKYASRFLKTLLLTFLTRPNDHGLTNVRAMVKIGLKNWVANWVKNWVKKLGGHS